MVLRALHLCSGYGGFELALRLAGVDAVTVAHVERDAYAAATLVARMEDACLDQAPVWSDLTTFDSDEWRGRVDLITAGFPCQPFSQAGQRRGVDDDRWLWPAIARIVADVGPRFVFLENVPQLVRLGLPHVLADLACLGFDAEWGLLSAAAVGASHLRQRLWILADTGSGGVRTSGRDDMGSRAFRLHVGDAGGTRRPEVTRRVQGDETAPQRYGDGHVADGPVKDVGGTASRHAAAVVGAGHSGTDADRAGRGPRPGQPTELADTAGVDEREPHHAGRAHTRQRARTDAGRLRFPPPPDDTDGWREWIAQGGPEPQVRRGADGPTGRMVRPTNLADQLHLLGNGLVPLAAAHALRQLSARLGADMTRPPYWDTAHYRALIAEDDRLEREQDDADRGRDRCDDDDDRRIDAGCCEWMDADG